MTANTKYLTLDESIVLSLIPYGNSQAIKREHFKITGLRDDRVRKIIGQLRDKGYHICSRYADGGGYYISDNPQDLLRYRKEMLSRAFVLLRRAGMSKDILNQVEGQIRLASIKQKENESAEANGKEKLDFGEELYKDGYEG